MNVYFCNFLFFYTVTGTSKITVCVVLCSAEWNLDVSNRTDCSMRGL